MKVYLCGEKGCCPYVEVTDQEAVIGEEGNMCRLRREEFDALKEKILSGDL
ncbi:MAG: hypothetical protein PHZ19_04725 [Candidatus Thermoplasmatota archaeon]|nr:hypothetical protein [Candidatus Thermoplasmatota archaeon]